ncbi:MAG: DUF5698 domain-containing protein [Desulfovibrionaceae bacterium]|nr:DUF5698 domain-containing protein [Desulfovibrionaceae bacterium]
MAFSAASLGLDPATLLLGALIFLARVADVTMGTLRTISTVQGRAKTAFFLGLAEISIWLAVVSAVVNEVLQKPILGAFYVLGFSVGNAVGIAVEKRIALGHAVVRVISADKGRELADALRLNGFAVTTFMGQGQGGPVMELYIACRRRDVGPVLKVVNQVQPGAFFVTELAGGVSRVYRPTMQQSTGWRAIFKKK